MVSVLVHIYYRESVQEFTERISLISQYIDKVYMNLVRENFFDTDGMKFPANYSLVSSANKGKDIGGKLVLMARYLLEQSPSEYLLFLHDKKSPQTPMSSFWSKNLFRILDPELVPRIMEILDREKNTGIVASSTYIRNEWDKKKALFKTSTNATLKELINKYEFKLADYRYVAGTMFWARSAVFADFFKKHDPLDILRTLECGNIMDNTQSTVTHAWERMLSWICTSQNLKIYGI